MTEFSGSDIPITIDAEDKLGRDERSGSSAKPSPYRDNPYHADITVPVALDAQDRRDELREIAIDLTYRANFQSWGDWSKYES